MSNILPRSRAGDGEIGYRVMPLGPEFEDDPQMVQLLELYQEMLKAEKLLEKQYRRPLPDVSPLIKKNWYGGVESCTRCHKKPSAKWKATTHAKAWDTLQKKDHVWDPECITCHVTGFGFQTGFVTHEKTPKLKHVGCESCHGALGYHVKDPDARVRAYEAKKRCTHCHNVDHSPGFEFKKYFDKIKHVDDR